MVNEHSKRIEIVYPNGSSSIEWLGDTLIEVGENRYRFEVAPMACIGADTEEELEQLPDYRDEFEAETVDKDCIRFVRVVERAPYRRYDWILSDKEVNNAALQRFTALVESVGGYWERVFGGVLFVFVPLDVELDFSGEFIRMFEESA